MIRVLIADDHDIVRKGLKTLLGEEPGMVVAGEARNGNEVFHALRKNRFDVAVLDISMPGESGLDLLPQLKKLHLRLPVIILSMHPEERFGYRALKVGASGYVTKDRAPSELIQAIRKVTMGGTFVSESLVETLRCGLQSGDAKLVHEMLSDREYQIMRLIAVGKSIKEIASDLSISAGTVYTHREHILEKMRLKTDVEIAHYAIVNNLVD